MTINQIADKLNVDKQTATGLVAFLRAKGLLIKVGESRIPGAKGKPSNLYALKDGATSELVTLMGQIGTTEEVFPPQAEEAQEPVAAVA